jgi:hypothetical protein
LLYDSQKPLKTPITEGDNNYNIYSYIALMRILGGIVMSYALPNNLQGNITAVRLKPDKK